MSITRNQQNYLVVFNPVPNRKRKRILSRLVTRLREQNLHWQMYPTSEDYSANEHYFKQHLQQYTDLIIVGGDGTFNLMVNFLVNTNIKVGLLPAGTGNDFARAWYGRKRNNLDQVLDIILSQDSESIHLGKCEFEQVGNSESKRSIRYFHNVLGTGFDSSLAKQLRHNKGWFQGLGYLLAAVRNIPFYREKSIALASSEVSETYLNLITAFANSRYFGSGMDIAPDADPKVSSMDVVSVEQYPLMTKLRLILLLMLGKHQGSKQVRYRTINEPVKIETEGLDLQADGEYIGQSPCVISIESQGIWLKR